MLCYLETPVLRFALLPYYRRIFVYDFQVPSHQSFYAVCDGHGGTDAVNYTASQLLMKLVSSDSFLTDASEALKEAIIETDKCFMEKATKEVCIKQ